MLRAMRYKRAMVRYARRNGLDVPAGLCTLSPRFGDAEKRLVAQIQRTAGLEATGWVDGPTWELLDRDAPFADRVARIAAAELHGDIQGRPFRWAGSPPTAHPIPGSSRSWPYRYAQPTVQSPSETVGPLWPDDSQWGHRARAYLRPGDCDDAGALSTAFCRFVLREAGYSDVWPTPPSNPQAWIDRARDGMSDSLSVVPGDEAKGGDIIAFHWGGKGRPDHLAISLRHRRYFHDAVTVAGLSRQADEDMRGVVVGLPLFTWQIEEVLRARPGGLRS